MAHIELQLYRSIGGDVILFFHDDIANRSYTYKLGDAAALKSAYGEGGTIFREDTPVNLALDLLAAWERHEGRAALAQEGTRDE